MRSLTGRMAWRTGAPEAQPWRGPMLKPPAFPNLPVLLIDDSAFARRILRSMLEPVGLREIIEAGDAEEALKRLSKVKPSLSLLDWNLPNISARELLAILR